MIEYWHTKLIQAAFFALVIIGSPFILYAMIAAEILYRKEKKEAELSK
jgi:hypothetical protein